MSFPRKRPPSVRWVDVSESRDLATLCKIPIRRTSAYAGMTLVRAGMTPEMVGVTLVRAEITKNETGVKSLFDLLSCTFACTQDYELAVRSDGFTVTKQFYQLGVITKMTVPHES